MNKVNPEEQPRDKMTESDIIQKIKDFYIENEEPLIRSKEYLIIDLLDRVG